VADATKRHLTAEHVAARALLDAASIDEAAPKILEAVCDSLGWEHGALWVLDDERTALRCARVWNPPSHHFPEFDDASRAATFPLGIGLPGRVWAQAAPVWIPDVARDTNFPRGPIAAREGLHAALGFPVMLRGEVLSVMEFFSREIREPDQDLIATLTSVGNQIGMFIDRHRAQEELDRFFNLSQDMLCVAGFDGYFKRVNPAWQLQLGYTPEELLSRPYMEFVYPEDRAATISAAAGLSTGEKLVYFENRYLHKDGTLRWLVWAATPLPEQQVIYATARDITDSKATEEAMHDLVEELATAKRSAEKAAATKRAFLDDLHDQLSTPLDAISEAARALAGRLGDADSAELTAIRDKADALRAVVTDQLDFSKIGAGPSDSDPAAEVVRDAVKDALANRDATPIEVVSARPDWVELLVPCTREAADRIQSVTAKLDPDLAPELRDKITYALRELLLNAIEWGGKLDPRHKVRISYLRAKRLVMYRISDPGPGFDITDLPHSAVGQPSGDPITHVLVREEKGMRPGGFGLLTVRASVDELLYNEKRNEVVFIKYLD
jgi:PAS domain S-box-containing protein